MTISETIESLIREKGISQRELAARAGISYTTLNTWITGRYQSIPSKYILPICAALSVTPLELLTGVSNIGSINTFIELSEPEMRLVEAYRASGLKCS